MSTNYNKACNEVLESIKYIDINLRDSIPRKIWLKLDENKDKNYKFKYDTEKNFEDQNFLQETKDIIACLYYKFWANTEEKQDFKKRMIEQEIKALRENK